MATTTSAKAGRKEALRSAACRSGAALSAPAAAAGPRLGGEGGGGNRWCLCCWRLRRCTASLALYRPEDYTAAARPRPRPGRTDTILHARFAFPAAAQELATAPTIAGAWTAGTQRRYCLGTRGLVSGVLRAWTRRCGNTEYSHPSCAEPRAAVVRTLHW